MNYTYRYYTHENIIKELQDVIIEAIQKIFDLDDFESVRSQDLEDELLETNFGDSLVYSHEVEKWFMDRKLSVFNSIKIIRGYELFHEGMVITNLHEAYRVVNKISYIIAKAIIAEARLNIEQKDETFKNKNFYAQADIDKIKKAIENVQYIEVEKELDYYLEYYYNNPENPSCSCNSNGGGG